MESECFPLALPTNHSAPMAAEEASVEMTRIERYGGKRLMFFVYSIRVIGAVAGICAAVLAIFGFLSLVGVLLMSFRRHSRFMDLVECSQMERQRSITCPAQTL